MLSSLETAPETTVGELKQLIHKKLGVSPMNQMLLFDEKQLESNTQALKECGIHDGALLTLVKSTKVYSKKKNIDECTKDVIGKGGNEEINHAEGHLRIEFRPDGKFLLMSDDDNSRQNNSGSGGYSWDCLDKFDVAVGTFEMNQDGSNVRCSFVKHFQRILKEEGSSGGGPSPDEMKDRIDSGWLEMEQVASLKWNRLDLSDSIWQVKVDDVATGGGSILGIPIKQTAASTLCGDGNFEKDDFSSAADDVLRLLGLDTLAS